MTPVSKQGGLVFEGGTRKGGSFWEFGPAELQADEVPEGTSSGHILNGLRRTYPDSGPGRRGACFAERSVTTPITPGGEGGCRGHALLPASVT